MAKRAKDGGTSGAVLGFEEKLWLAADKLRGSKGRRRVQARRPRAHLPRVHLRRVRTAPRGAREGARRRPRRPRRVRRGPTSSGCRRRLCWPALQGFAKQPTIGVTIDAAMVAVERENPSLEGTLPKEYARPTLDKQRLGELIDLLGSVGLHDVEQRTRDVLGRVYEYFLGRFAAAEGRLGGEFFTPQSVVRVLVEMVEPFKGRVYDPCCGSGGMFVQSERFVEARGGKPHDLAVYGQEWNATTWRLCRMNLSLRGIEADLGKSWGNSFHDDQHRALEAHFILANPPFNVSDWGDEHLREDARWAYGTPPVGNANFAWLQHIASHLTPDGVAGVVLANGSMSSQQSNEGVIRKEMVERDLVDCMVALPGQLFYVTQIPVCLWFLARNKADGRYRNRRGEVLFLDARKMGALVDRTHRELSDDDVARLARTYHAWLARQDAEGWGAKVIDRLSQDLRDACPEMKGLSSRNLRYMRDFAAAWPDLEIVQRAVAKLPWRQNIALLDRLKDADTRLWYAEQALRFGWSQPILVPQIDGRAHERQGKALNNFAATLPPGDSDLAAQVFKDPYLFDFLGTADPRREREVELALVEHVQRFLLEMGAGFAFVGRQVHLEVGDQDLYVDLLFYHLKLRRYVVVELKAVPFDPSFVGQINVYLSAVDDLLRHPGDKPTIGLLLCRSKHALMVEYALRDLHKPIGVAEWETALTECLPKELEGTLPTIEALEAELGTGGDDA